MRPAATQASRDVPRFYGPANLAGPANPPIEALRLLISEATGLTDTHMQYHAGP